MQSGYQLLIQSFVPTNYGPFLIDNIFVEVPASILGDVSPPQTYTYVGEFHADLPVTIDLRYSLGCSPNYTMCSVDSSLQCIPENQCIDGMSNSMCEKTFLYSPLPSR